MNVFKKNKIERISSPDQMDDCIRVTTPAVWVTLFALLALLAALLAWNIFGTLELHDEDGNTFEIHPITYVTN